MTRILILLCAAASVAAAANNWERVAQISPHAPVHVRTFDGVVHSGTLRSVDADYVRVTEDGQEVSVARQDVARVEEHTASRRVRNMIIGGAIGASVGIVAGFATCPSCPGETSPSEFHKRLYTGGLAGGGIGAALGAIPSSYKTVYKAKRSRR